MVNILLNQLCLRGLGEKLKKRRCKKDLPVLLAMQQTWDHFLLLMAVNIQLKYTRQKTWNLCTGPIDRLFTLP